MTQEYKQTSAFINELADLLDKYKAAIVSNSEKNEVAFLIERGGKCGRERFTTGRMHYTAHDLRNSVDWMVRKATFDKYPGDDE